MKIISTDQTIVNYILNNAKLNPLIHRNMDKASKKPFHIR